MPFVFLLALVLSGISEAHGVEGYYSFGYGTGGSDLSPITGGQNYDIQSGAGLSLTGGGLFSISPTVPHRFELQVGLGYLFRSDTRQRDNEVSWVRWPLEAIYFYRNTRESFRLGWGVTYHIGNKISGTGSQSNLQLDVDNSLGWVAQCEIVVPLGQDKKAGFGYGFRYTWMDYSSKSFLRAVTANSLSFTMSFFVN